ncbi:MAG: Rieske 2Fe-2S domain-containing protein [Thermoprotei archaeon]|jgi:Rieske Fe-S protein
MSTNLSSEGKISRRTFVKIVLAASGVLTIGAFTPLISYLGGQVTSVQAQNEVKIGNLNDLTKLADQANPPIVTSIFLYPPEPDAYYTNMLIVHKTPDKSGNLGDYDVRAFNRTCVHLQCLVNYNPNNPEFGPVLQCPCHGSVYRLTDALPLAGPAKLLNLNPLPQVILKIVKSTGDIYAIGFNGKIVLGRPKDQPLKEPILV